MKTKLTGFYWIKWLMLVAIVCPVGYCSSIATLNYSGFCFDQSRYLSKDEFIKSGISGVLGHYPSIRFVPEGATIVGKSAAHVRLNYPGANEKGIAITASQLIPYRDAEEFTSLNPDCCSFGSRGLYSDVGQTDDWMKITGYSAGFFNAKYQIRYRDSTGLVRSGWTADTFHYANCGHSNHGY
jgi:hypothetical protein